MSFNADKHHRRSIRLKDYDYSQKGAYFVTLCTIHREWLFGDVDDGEMIHNEYGRLVQQEWLQTAVLRPNVELDAFVVMPNHLHGIIVITDSCLTNAKLGGVGAQHAAPLQVSASSRSMKVVPGSLGAIVRGFKSAVTRQINLLRNTPSAPVWQQNYYEEIIRNQPMLDNIRQYIDLNPLNWHNDSENT